MPVVLCGRDKYLLLMQLYYTIWSLQLAVSSVHYSSLYIYSGSGISFSHIHWCQQWSLPSNTSYTTHTCLINYWYYVAPTYHMNFPTTTLNHIQPDYLSRAYSLPYISTYAACLKWLLLYFIRVHWCSLLLIIIHNVFQTNAFNLDLFGDTRPRPAGPGNNAIYMYWTWLWLRILIYKILRRFGGVRSRTSCRNNTGPNGFF